MTAFSPALNETVLFGGLSNAAHIADGDTWIYTGGRWSESQTTGGPAARWSGGMVYDVADQYLLLFGGRNQTQYFNDTWTFNSTGWHEVSTVGAPSPRAFFAMTYDAADGYVLLFGGGVLSPQTTFFNDTWAYHAGVWTNLTGTAGPAPAGRQVEGQMAYDAATSEVVLTGGIERYVACPFPASLGLTYMFSGGRWSTAPVAGPSPPSGRGAIWYDPITQSLVYYESEENLSGADCLGNSNQVWSYTNDSWTLVPFLGGVAPIPRVNPAALWDPQDESGWMFGGDQLLGNPDYGPVVDLHDTWRLNLTVVYSVSFHESVLPAGTDWHLNISGGHSGHSDAATLTLHLPDGAYTYRAGSNNPNWGESLGSFTVRGQPINVAVFSSPSLYSVSFTETGLPAKVLLKKGWTVVLNGTYNHSTSSSIDFAGVPNGTYPVLVIGPTKYLPLSPATGKPASGGSVTVQGSTAVGERMIRTIGVTLAFHEKGLRRGTEWCVLVQSYQRCTSTSKAHTLKFANIWPGSWYNFTVEPVAGYSGTYNEYPVPTPVELFLSTGTTIQISFTPAS